MSSDWSHLPTKIRTNRNFLCPFLMKIDLRNTPTPNDFNRVHAVVFIPTIHLFNPLNIYCVKEIRVNQFNYMIHPYFF